MKVCLVADYIPGFHKKWSGAEIFCHNLYESLKNKNYQVSVLSTPFDMHPIKNKEFIQIFSLIGYRNKIAKILKPCFIDLVSLFHCLFILFKMRPDIIHIHSKYLLAPAVLSAKFLRIKTVYTFLDYYLFCHRNTFLKDNGDICQKRQGVYCSQCSIRIVPEGVLKYIFRPIFICIAWLRSFINGYLSKNIDRYIALSSACKQRAVSQGIPEDKVSVVYYYRAKDCLDKPCIDSIVHDGRYEDINADKRHILFVGSVSYHKGLEVLISALPYIIREYPDVQLLIGVGDAVASHLKRIKSLVDELKLREHVAFLPKINNEEVIKFICFSDVVVVPEQWPNEFGPVILVEALHCGIPVVASRIGGIPEFVREGETGFLFRPTDEKELAAKVSEVFKNEGFREQARQQRSLACREILPFRNDITEVYRDVLEQG